MSAKMVLTPTSGMVMKMLPVTREQLSDAMLNQTQWLVNAQSYHMLNSRSKPYDTSQHSSQYSKVWPSEQFHHTPHPVS